MEKKRNLAGYLCGTRTVAALLMTAIAALLLAQPATAQRTVGGQGLPNVVIDYSVLDALGPAPNVPEVLKRKGEYTPTTRRPVLGSRGGLPLPPRSGVPRFPMVSGDGKNASPGHIVLKRPSRGIKKRAAKVRKKQPRRTAAKQMKRQPKPKPARKQARRTPPPMVTTPPPPVTITPLPAVRPVPKPVAQPKTKIATPPRAPAPPPAVPAPPVKPPPMVKQAAKPAPKPKAPPKAVPTARKRPPRQTAALPPSQSEIRAGGSLQLKFGAASAKLNSDATRKLKSVAEAMAKDTKLRLQLLAYAGASAQGTSQARRLSLSRALSARSYLIGAGVRSTRIDVRALGNKSEGGPPHRIDVIVTKR